MKWSVVLFALAVSPAQAQVLLVEPMASDPQALRFNAEFIQRNGIVSISGTNSVKREGQPMREKSERSAFRFDAYGRTEFSSTSYGRPGSGHDTTSTTWSFDAQGRPVEQTRNDPNGCFALRDSLDLEGRTIQQAYVRISAAENGEPARTTLISEDRFAWHPINDTALRKTWMNDRGLPYREQVFRKDQWGYLRTIDDHYLITGKRGRITFRYAEKGRLAERIEQADLAQPRSIRHIWRYDAPGNVTLCDHYLDERLIRHTEYLYEESTMLLKAVLVKDNETGLIHITRYTTQRR